MRHTILTLVAVAAAVLGVTAPAGAAPADMIRVGGPSAPLDAKVAVVASRAHLVGRAFVVVRGSNVVLRGRLKRAAGSPSPWANAATADLSAIRHVGTYRVRVGRLRSPVWVVKVGAARPLIARLTRIYVVNADGNESNPVFGPAHLNDAVAPIVGGPTAGGTVDVTGGWRDAGDAIKFTTTIAMSSLILDTVARLDTPDARRLGQLSDVGIRYLIKAHPAGSQTFIAQVGDDHDHDQLAGSSGGGFAHGFARDYAGDDALASPAFSRRTAYGDAGSGVLGAGAAGLASAALRAGPTTPAGQVLTALAREWYARGKAVSAPGPKLGGFEQAGTKDGDWQGFMALAAVRLWRAGGGDGLLDDATTYLGQTHFDEGFNLYVTVGGLAAADICGGLGEAPVTSAPLRALGCRKLADIRGLARGRAASNAFGAAGAFQFGSIADILGGPALAAAGTRGGGARDGFALAAGARDYLVGGNPWGAGFVMGPGAREARNPQHSVILKGRASIVGNGFVVGGPATAGSFKDFGIKLDPKSRYARFDPTYGGERIVYEDRTDDYITSEVGLAYTGPALLLLSELYAPR